MAAIIFLDFFFAGRVLPPHFFFFQPCTLHSSAHNQIFSPPLPGYFFRAALQPLALSSVQWYLTPSVDRNEDGGGREKSEKFEVKRATRPSAAAATDQKTWKFLTFRPPPPAFSPHSATTMRRQQQSISYKRCMPRNVAKTYLCVCVVYRKSVRGRKLGTY